MPTDYLVAFIASPFGVLVLAILVLVPVRMTHMFAPASFAELKRNQIIGGYCAAMLAMLALAVLETAVTGMDKVHLGHITADELPQWVLSWTFYMFCLIVFFGLLLLSWIGFPLLAFLHSKGRASILSLALSCVAAALLSGLLTLVFPSNQWEGSHQAQAFHRSFMSTLVPFIAIYVSFGLGARLAVHKQATPNAT